MAAGYFSDETTNVGLDEEPSGLVSGQGFGPIILQPWNKTQATLFQRGGGYMNVRVKWTINRYNRGDAEWYVYQKCKNLALIGTGELYVQGNVYEHAVCLSCTASIEEPAHDGNLSSWSCKVLMNVVFEVSIPEDTTDPSPTYSAPATPGEYTSRTSDGEFTFGGSSFADAPLLLTPSLQCQHVRHLLPRAYGVFHEDQTSGAVIRLQLEGTHWKSTRALLEDDWRDILTTIRDDVGDLVGNGNTYSKCYMADAPSMDDSDRRFSAFGIGFSHAPTYVYAEYVFKTIQVATQSDVIADLAEDTLTLVGVGITITTQADTVTFRVGVLNYLSDVSAGSPTENDILWSTNGTTLTSAQPDIAGVMAKTEDQTIAGIKTATGQWSLPVANPTTNNQMAHKRYVDESHSGGYTILCPISYNSQAQGTWVNSPDGDSDYYVYTFNSSNADNDQLDYKVPMSSGLYKAVIICQKEGDAGKLYLSIDGDAKTNVDLYTAGATEYNHRHVSANFEIIASGIKTLSIYCNGKHASSTGYVIRFQRIILIRLS